MSGPCQCCGHSVNSHQRDGLCSGCEDLLAAISALPKQTQTHLLAKATGAKASEVMNKLHCGYSTNGSMVQSARKITGASVDRLVQVARYGMAGHLLPTPKGFEQPTFQTPAHEPPQPKTLERVVIETPRPGPVVVEHREPEPVQMLTDRAEDAPLPRAVAEANQAMEEEKPMPQTHEGRYDVAQDAITSLLSEARKAAHDAGMDYQVAFAELAHLVLTGEGLPDMGLVHLAYRLGEAKGRVLALEALS